MTMILTQAIAFQEFWRPSGVQSLTKLTKKKVKPFYFIFVKKECSRLYENIILFSID